MSTFDVYKLTDRQTAEELNSGLDDDNKVAFQDELGTTFFARYDTDMSSVDVSKYSQSTITQADVDGSLPVTKLRRIYP